MQMHCLERRLRDTSIAVTSVHPGMVDTEIGRDYDLWKVYGLFKQLNRWIGEDIYLNSFNLNSISHSYQLEQSIYFEGLLGRIFLFNQILIEHSVSK